MNNIISQREVVSLSNKPTLIISDKLHGQITALHNAVGKCEWSGALFLRRLAGDISQPSNLVYRAELLMLGDIGSATYTEFEFGEETMKFYDAYEEEIEDVDDLKMGLIHTHHSMSTFFSSTDMAELQDNSPHHNYYISLIVNLDSQWCAKVAFIAKRKSDLAFTGSEGDSEIMSLTETEVLVTMDFNIVMSTDQYLLDSIVKCKAIQAERNKPKIPYVTHRPQGITNMKPSPLNDKLIGNKKWNPNDDWNDLLDDKFGTSTLPFKPLSSIDDLTVDEFLAKVISLNPSSTQDLGKDILPKLFKLEGQAKEDFPMLITDKIIEQSHKAVDEKNEYSIYELCEVAVVRLDDLQFDHPLHANILEAIIKVLEDCYNFKYDEQ